MKFFVVFTCLIAFTAAFIDEDEFAFEDGSGGELSCREEFMECRKNNGSFLECSKAWVKCKKEAALEKAKTYAKCMKKCLDEKKSCKEGFYQCRKNFGKCTANCFFQKDQ